MGRNSNICVVTGATGFVGLNLLEALVNDTTTNWTVLAVSRQKRSRTGAIDRFLPASVASQIYYIQATVQVDGSLQQAVDEKLQELHATRHDVTTIFHLIHLQESSRNPARVFSVAGYRPEGYDEHIRLNKEAMDHVLLVAESSRARVIYCSSWSSYGIQPPGTMLVEDATHDLSHRPVALGFFGLNPKPIPYMVAKRTCELQLQAAVKAERIPGGVIFQPSSIFGKYGQAGWSQFFGRLVRTHGKMPAFPGASSFCDVEQLTKAFCVAAGSLPDKIPGEVKSYLIGGTNATNHQMFQIMAELVGVPSPSAVVSGGILMMISRWNETMIQYLPLWLAKLLLIKADKLGCPFLTAKLCQSQGTLSQKAQHLLGYQPLPLPEILRSNYEWLVQEGILPSTTGTTKKLQ